MQRAPANKNRPKGKDRFALSVKVALLERGETVSELARELGLARNTVSLAINRGLYQPTRHRIAKHLDLSIS